MLTRFLNSTKTNSGGSGAVAAAAQQNVTAAAAKNNDADGLGGSGMMDDFEESNRGLLDGGDGFEGGEDDMMNFGDFDQYNMNGLGGVGGDEYGTNAYDDGAYGGEDIKFNSYDDGMDVGLYDSSISIPGMDPSFDSSGDPTGTSDGNDGGDLQVHQGPSGSTDISKDGNGNGSTMIRRSSGLSILSKNKTGSTAASTKASGGAPHGMSSHPVQKKIVPVGGKLDGHTNTNGRSLMNGQTGHPSNKSPATPSTIDHDSSFRRIVPVPPTIHKTPRTVTAAAGGGRNSKDGSTTNGVVLTAGTKTPKATPEFAIYKVGDSGSGRQLSVTPSPYPRGGERPGGESFMVDTELTYQTPNGRFNNTPYVTGDGRMRDYMGGEGRDDEEQAECGEEEEYDEDLEEMDVEQAQEQLMGVLQQLADIHEENVDQISHLEDIVEDATAKLLHIWKKQNDIHDEYEEMDTEMDHFINKFDSFMLKNGLSFDGPDP